MNCRVNKKTSAIYFEALDCSDTFCFSLESNTVFMKIRETNINNAVDLSNGYSYLFDKRSMVYPVVPVATEISFNMN